MRPIKQDALPDAAAINELAIADRVLFRRKVVDAFGPCQHPPHQRRGQLSDIAVVVDRDAFIYTEHRHQNKRR